MFWHFPGTGSIGQISSKTPTGSSLGGDVRTCSPDNSAEEGMQEPLLCTTTSSTLPTHHDGSALSALSAAAAPPAAGPASPPAGGAAAMWRAASCTVGSLGWAWDGCMGRQEPTTLTHTYPHHTPTYTHPTPTLTPHPHPHTPQGQLQTSYCTWFVPLVGVAAASATGAGIVGPPPKAALYVPLVAGALWDCARLFRTAPTHPRSAVSHSCGALVPMAVFSVRSAALCRAHHAAPAPCPWQSSGTVSGSCGVCQLRLMVHQSVSVWVAFGCVALSGLNCCQACVALWISTNRHNPPSVWGMACVGLYRTGSTASSPSRLV